LKAETQPRILRVAASSNNSMPRAALRAAADAERWALTLLNRYT